MATNDRQAHLDVDTFGGVGGVNWDLVRILSGLEGARANFRSIQSAPGHILLELSHLLGYY